VKAPAFADVMPGAQLVPVIVRPNYSRRIFTGSN